MGKLTKRQLNRVRTLIDELREIDAWPAVEVDAALLMMDLLNALEVDPLQIEDLMGRSAIAYIHRFGGIRPNPCESGECP